MCIRDSSCRPRSLEMDFVLGIRQLIKFSSISFTHLFPRPTRKGIQDDTSLMSSKAVESENLFVLEIEQMLLGFHIFQNSAISGLNTYFVLEAFLSMLSVCTIEATDTYRAAKNWTSRIIFSYARHKIYVSAFREEPLMKFRMLCFFVARIE